MSTELALSNFERQDQLARFVEERQRVSIAQICEHFGISLATARRDLEALANAHRIQRIHGGAISIKNAPPEPPYPQRSSDQAIEKRKIGQATADLIEEGETVFLGSGTTVLEVANALRRQNLHGVNVITNSLLVMNALAGAAGITLLSLGGVLRPSEMSFIGHVTEQALAGLRADKVIIGIRAIDLERGLSSEYLPESHTDQAILRMGTSIILVADHSKCGRVSTTHVAPLSIVNVFVTDDGTAPEYIDAFQANGSQVLVV
ncbi:MAG: DeoR/GlpR transcriptional regulator [Anaerolineae bacterium]|nr:DeoR/GlpR transcriptional regulator [Anaerolineae bacterium]